MSAAISFDGVTKHYRGAREYRALRDDLAGVVGRVAGRKRSPRTPVHALEDVSFEIPEGQSFALIGANGAGKTTALRIASRITYPTSGRVRVRGRVGALIEVGTGLHPELSGRENVRLHGRILGLSRRDIEARFDRIVEFAEVQAAIDRPVKQFSSGMQLRLGFSIAAHLEPDILLVDEALAVGDAGFQAKSVTRMLELLREGLTILFVSHNLYAVEMLCPHGIYLQEGQIALEGPIQRVLRKYLGDVDSALVNADGRGSESGFSGGPVTIAVRGEGPDGRSSLRTAETLTIRCDYECLEPGLRAFFHFGVTDGRAGNIFLASQVLDGDEPLELARRGSVRCTVPALPLLPRVYEIWGEVRVESGWGNYIDWQQLARFRVESSEDISSVSHSAMDAPVAVPFVFSHTKGEMQIADERTILKAKTADGHPPGT
jgi:ABC-type polysaccharide/polyol phosphate transport system ATPase subunit